MKITFNKHYLPIVIPLVTLYDKYIKNHNWIESIIIVIISVIIIAFLLYLIVKEDN